ncbi:deoxyribonuclease IV [bacterium]|nr:MAG: deoxyribonuclease IV [bacterium]
MQLLGAHMSIAGGVQNSLVRAEKLGCTAMQIFLKQPRKLFDREISYESIEEWKKNLKKIKTIPIDAILAHTGYLINLAVPDDEKWESYISAMADEMSRADSLGILHIVLHPGSPHDRDEKWGIRRVASAIDKIYSEEKFDVNIALETTAVTGSHLGWKFEHLADIIFQSKFSEKLDVVFDTCHAYAAGYDFTTQEKYEHIWDEFDRIIGLKKLVGIHLNDSKHPLGSRKDRHEHIGKGFLGIEPFKSIMQDSRFVDIPKVIETPKDDDWDNKNLKLLRELSL